MIEERELTRLMEQLAQAYEVPENGQDAILEATGADKDRSTTDRGVGRHRRGSRLLPAAAVVVLVAVGAAVVGTLGQGSVDTFSSKAAPGTDENGRQADSAPAVGPRSSTTATDRGPVPVFGGPSGQVQVQAQPQAQVQAQMQPQSPPAAAAGAGGIKVTRAGGSGLEPGARVVKTGEVRVEIGRGRFDVAVERLAALAVGRGGFIAQSETTEGGTAPKGSVTLRVPAGEFDAVLAEVRQLGKVASASTRGQDVTAQYSDIEARVRALGATRDQILTVLSKASTVGDILAVQERLNSVQVQIEQLQGQQKLIDDQTTFGTITVRLAEPGARIDEPKERSGLAHAWDEASNRFMGGLEAIVAGSGTVLIVALALAVLTLAVRAAWLLARRHLV